MTKSRRIQNDSYQANGGITLVELMVVISIIVILMAIGSRVLVSSADGRRTREAARQVSVYFSLARNQAMETGRPCGVMLRRRSDLPQCAELLDHVEVPPPYAGDTLDAVAQLKLKNTSGGVATVTAQMTPPLSPGLVSEHDQVQFNYQGPFYEIVNPLDVNLLTLHIDLSQGQMLPWPNAPAHSAPVPYQIFRRPRKSAASTLQLPARTVIDLETSGTDGHSIGAGTGEPVCIMFSPNGSLERVCHDGHVHPGAEPIFLLVGKLERLPAGGAEDGLANWQDTTNYWVTLNPQTGQVTTTEVAKGNNYFESRKIAREGQSIGGR